MLLRQAHLALLRTRLSHTDPLMVAGAARRASVVVPFCLDVNNEPALLFTKRSEELPTHKGQVSFPGGMYAKKDSNATECGLRELEEELGIHRSAVDVLGMHKSAPNRTGTISITPVVAYLGKIDPSQLNYCKREVDAVFTLTLAQVTDKSARDTMAYEGLQLPVVSAGPYPLWGITLYILDRLLADPQLMLTR